MRDQGTRLHFAAALVGGSLVGLSLPPIGAWPMAIVGVAAIAWAISDRSFASRLGLGMLAGLGQFSISLAWAIQFNIAGYIALSLLEAAFVAVACGLVPSGRGRLPGLTGGLVLAELARESWPFGGLPLGGIALGQMDGPLGMTARVGGPLLVVGVTVLAGAALAAVLHRRGANPAAALLGVAGAIALVAVAAVAPNGTTGPGQGTTREPRQIRVALVQGGGERGLDQLQVPASVVLAAAIKATGRVPEGVQLILWPEDVVGLNSPFAGSGAEALLSAIARRHRATLLAGVTYPVGATRFRNEIVAFAPTGALVATFEKVHRVPFGEYVPDRGFFKHFANLSDVPRDAIAGTGSGMIATPVGRVAILVSYEVFFSNRGLSGVRAGGEVILVPTNTSSYSSPQAPSQEIAASELQALEEGRYVLQAAPTGYSAVVSNDGTVKARTKLSLPALITATVPLLSGSTWYERFGDTPVLLASVLSLCAGWTIALSRRGRPRRRRRSSPPS